MRDPWLFWTGVAFLPFAAVCLYHGMHATEAARERRLEVAGRAMAGMAAIAIGYECAFRTAVASVPELKTNTAIGLFFLVGGLLCVGNAVLRTFNR